MGSFWRSGKRGDRKEEEGKGAVGERRGKEVVSHSSECEIFVPSCLKEREKQ